MRARRACIRRDRSMKIATWNVNGIRARQDEVAAFVAREQPDVLCLQEIKAAADHIPKTVGDIPGYWSYWHGTKGYSGVALLIRQARRARPSALPPPGVRSRDAHRRGHRRRRAGGVDLRPERRQGLRRQGALSGGDGRLRGRPCARSGTQARPVRRPQRGARADRRPPQGARRAARSASAPTSGRCSSASSPTAACTTWRASASPTTTRSSPGGPPGGTCASATSAGGSTTCSPATTLAARVESCVSQREVGTSDHAPVVATFR